MLSYHLFYHFCTVLIIFSPTMWKKMCMMLEAKKKNKVESLVSRNLLFIGKIAHSQQYNIIQNFKMPRGSHRHL